jgi:agmatine/peptidylarginine deiminase
VWRAAAAPAKKAFTDVILTINRFEPVTVLAPSDLVRCTVKVISVVLVWLCASCP